MKNILKKYPIEKEEQKILFSYPVFTMDLHGFSQIESQKKLDWLLQYSHKKKGETFQIITGIGSGVLRMLVLRTLKKWKNQNKIISWNEKNNEYLDDIIKTKNKETGVFLFL